jgi:sugar lactone lactonase YvrE
MGPRVARPSIAPRVWAPPPLPERSREPASVSPLPPLQRVPVGGHGPEDVVVEATGRVVTGLADGRLVGYRPDTGQLDAIGFTGGRPLGIELLPDGRLLVCDARQGLLAVDPAGGAVQTLLRDVAGEPLRFCNNAAVARDGTIYFSDSSRVVGIDHWRGDILAHSGTGRLLRRDPEGRVETLLDGLQFANGVALSADESFVAVAETGGYRVARLWLNGGRSGQRDLLADDLPGFPDNIALGTDGLIWVTQASPRVAALDRLHRLPPVYRRLVWRLPESVQPKPPRTVWLLAYDAAGRLVHDLQAPGREFGMVTGVRERHGRVWLGSLIGSCIAYFDLAAASGS